MRGGITPDQATAEMWGGDWGGRERPVQRVRRSPRHRKVERSPPPPWGGGGGGGGKGNSLTGGGGFRLTATPPRQHQIWEKAAVTGTVSQQRKRPRQGAPGLQMQCACQRPRAEPPPRRASTWSTTTRTWTEVWGSGNPWGGRRPRGGRHSSQLVRCIRRPREGGVLRIAGGGGGGPSTAPTK